MRANDSLRWGCYWLQALLWLCLCVAAARAQYRFDHWTADDGLPQNIITALHQTRDGYLWVATLDGLARFDGVRFTTFDKSNSPGIKNNRFTSLYEDGQGDLWLGTESSGVTRYSRGRFTTYATEHGLPPGFVQGLMGDETGQHWVWSDDWIRQWQPADERFIEISAPRFPSGYHRSVWDNRGGLWGLDQAGLHHFDGGRWQRYTLPAGVRDINDYTVAQTPDGAIWLRDASGRLTQLREGKVVPVVQSPASSPTRAHSDWQLIYRDRQGKPWMMIVDRKLGRSLTAFSSDRLERVAFSILFEDSEGHLWLGTDGQGLYRVRKQVITTLSEPQGLVARNVYPVYEDRAGAVWIGAWQGGLSRFQNGKFTNYTTQDGLAPGAVSGLCEDREGRLWVAISNTLQLFQDGKFTPVTPGLLPDRTSVDGIYQDRAGALWMGTDRGLLRYHDGATTVFTTRDGLASDNVRVIIEAASGALWIGCYGGLTRLADGKFTSWTEQDGLPSNMVRALYEDREGTLWIGTYDGGLGRFRDGKFTRYTTRDGLFNNGAFQILEDARGWFWLSCNRGIYRVRRQELNEFAAGRLGTITSVAYGRGDGLLNVECNGGLWPAGAKTRDGRLWFPTQDGVAVIDPATMTTNLQPPPVVIESFLLDRRPIAFDGGVQLKPGQTSFEIEYTALSFINSEHLRFRYKLEGLEHDWIDAGTRRTVYYSHVPPGEYTFKVIAANSDGVWNSEGQSLRVVVLPPFYRMWWFLTLAVLLVGSAIFAAFKYRVAQLERRQAAQQAFARQLIESQEQERKRIAAELHDSLGQHLVVIKNLALMWLQKPTHDGAQQQIEDISATTSQAISEVKEISYNLRPYQLDRIGLTKAIEALLKKAETASGIRFQAELDDLQDALLKEDEINFYRIVQECVNNILKHSQATEATVSIHRHGGQLRIRMRDNGKGFTPGTTTGDAAKGGFGLIGIAERAQLLGGQTVIQSAPGQGTTINLEIELNHGDARNNGQ